MVAGCGEKIDIRRRLVIIGLDGVPYDLLKDLTGKGIMPNVKDLISQGLFTKMRSSLPEVSSVAWSSIITGKNPAEHAIFGFTDLYPHSYKLRFSNFNDLKSPPFWEDNNLSSVIINVPSTYPVREMRGVHISGFVSIDLERSVYPQSLIPHLKSLDYRLDVDSEKAYKSMDLFLSDLDKTLSARIKTSCYLWDNFAWKTFMLVFTETDRLMHFLWSAYENETSKYHRDFLEHFRKIDNAIGEIREKMAKDDILIMLSDHGFERLDKDIYVSYLLKKEGFLGFKDTEQQLGNISNSTKAFALDPARIYINSKGKFPSGSVEKSDKGRVIDDLEEAFKNITIDNRKIIRDIYRKEDIYSGPFLEQAPDLILVGNNGFNLKADIKTDAFTANALFTGKHTQDTAFLLISQAVNNEIVPDFPSVDMVRGIIKI